MLDGRKKRQVKNVADQVLFNFQINSETVDVYSILNRMDVTVMPLAEMDGSISGFSLTSNGKRVVGVLASDLNTARGRFTMAHELGHLMLHQNSLVNYSPPEMMFRHTSGPEKHDSKEVEANYFAACLLMPEERVHSVIADFISKFKMPSHNIEAIADRFGVSQAAMTFRLIDLGYSMF